MILKDLSTSDGPDLRVWLTRLGNAVLAWRLRRAAGVAVHDLGPMRAGRREQLLAPDLRDRRFGYPLEMVLRAARTGCGSPRLT